MKVKGLNFKPIDPKQIPAAGFNKGRPSRYLATLAEFLKSGAAAVEVDTLNTSVTAGQLRKQARLHGLTEQLDVIARQGRVFILRRTK